MTDLFRGLGVKVHVFTRIESSLFPPSGPSLCFVTGRRYAHISPCDFVVWMSRSKYKSELNLTQT